MSQWGIGTGKGLSLSQNTHTTPSASLPGPSFPGDEAIPPMDRDKDGTGTGTGTGTMIGTKIGMVSIRASYSLVPREGWAWERGQGSSVCTLGLQVGTTNSHGSGGATHPIIQFQYDVVCCFIRSKLQVYHSVHTQLCDGD